MPATHSKRASSPRRTSCSCSVKSPRRAKSPVRAKSPKKSGFFSLFKKKPATKKRTNNNNNNNIPHPYPQMLAQLNKMYPSTRRYPVI